MNTSQPEVLFSMSTGYAPLTNLLGAGDPNVHWIDGRWWMFFGAFRTTLRNNIFAATLAPGEPLHEGMRWRVHTHPSSHRRALPLVPQPGRAAWDRYGLHEPSYVEGLSADGSGRPVRRLYYTGRSSPTSVGNTSPYSIGMLELTPVGWQRHPRPVLTGTARNPSALGPKVVYSDGMWRMWFRSTTGEPAKGERPVSEIHYTESVNGIDAWSTPRPFYTRAEGFAHAFVHRTPEGFEMLLSKSPNLFGDDSYPEQKLWISSSARASGEISDWSTPTPVLDAESGPAWYRGGFFGSSLCVADGCSPDPGERFVFFTGAHTPLNWPRTALRRLCTGKRPPVPAPFYFTIGSVPITVGPTPRHKDRGDRLLPARR